MTLSEALESDAALTTVIAVSPDLGHAIEDLSYGLVVGATLSKAENLSGDTFIDAYTEAATVITELDELAYDESLTSNPR